MRTYTLIARASLARGRVTLTVWSLSVMVSAVAAHYPEISRGGAQGAGRATQSVQGQPWRRLPGSLWNPTYFMHCAMASASLGPVWDWCTPNLLRQGRTGTPHSQTPQSACRLYQTCTALQVLQCTALHKTASHRYKGCTYREKGVALVRGLGIAKYWE